MSAYRQTALVASAQLGQVNDFTEVELVWLKKRIENWIRFGRIVGELVLDRDRRLVSFAPGSIFALVRWAGNDFGTVASRIDILRAVAEGERYTTVPYVRPGAEILLQTCSWTRSNRCGVWQAIDIVEKLGIDPADAAPGHWHHVHNRLTANEKPRPYTRTRHQVAQAPEDRAGIGRPMTLIAMGAAVDPALIETAIGGLGLWAPFAHIALFAAGTVLFVPGAILGLAGGALFGPLWGTIVNLAGATLGATFSFLVARYLVAGWVRRKAGGRIERLIAGVEAEGWRFVAFVRLVPLFPFNLTNYAIGLTQIPLAHYVLASLVCMAPGTWGMPAEKRSSATRRPSAMLSLLLPFSPRSPSCQG